MNIRSPLLWFVVAIGVAGSLRAQATAAVEPLVFVVADGERATALDEMLRAGGLRLRHLATADCTPKALRLADVVVVDWPDDRDLGATSPLGELERWDRPTVFLGSSGERFARSWWLPTPNELTEFDTGARGPEAWSFDPPDDAKSEVLRQGNLFYFRAPLSTVLATSGERAWFAWIVRHAARFTADRPIIRRPPGGRTAVEAERLRTERIDSTAQLLGMDIRSRDDLLALPAAYRGDHGKEVATMLRDLIVDGLDAEWSQSNWNSWLKSRVQQLVWDELAYAWRIDPLAFWRGVPSAQLHGDARADAPEPSAEAVALAAKVVHHYGGRALDDLATFTCWHGDVCWLWDRRNGYFRMENHHVLPAGRRATAWRVSVLDTAADREVIWGGGPPPRPRVSARSSYRELVTRAFLPALLLEPSTALTRDPDGDSAGLQMLVVRLGQRGLDPRMSYHLLVDPTTGVISQLEEQSDGRGRAIWLLDETLACGPMQVLNGWSSDDRRRATTFAIELPAWNPALPAGVESATGQLTRPRER